ncbi:MAG: HEAT repeat domain-containing protein [Saprospiraceae bacterium]|nr:HEAT repeat domain-containing protein [Saprospiraceae bacterium]
MVLDLQDRQQTDSLLLLLSSKDATTRYWAAMAFASIKDKNAIDTLAQLLLHDRLDSVKIAAAYSLGQIGDTTAQRYLIAAFDTEDTTGASFNKYVLEAIGKCGTAFFLPLMSSVTTYQATDTALIEGQVLGIYHFMLRNIVHPSGTNRMLSLVAQLQYPSSVRLVAASYLARGQRLGLDTLIGVDSTLSAIFQQEADAEIRMALALGVGKTNTPLAKSALLQQFNIEQDYRVKCNIIRALRQFDYLSVRDTIFAALRDTNLHVVHTINEYLLEKGISRDANTYRRLAQDSTFSPIVKVGLLTAANKHMPNYFYRL